MRVVFGFVMVVGALGASVGCGGSSFVADEDPQAGASGSMGGGSGGSGGSGTGGTGTGGTAMSGGSGGTGTGGSMSAGGSMSVGGSNAGGSGGTGVGGSGVGASPGQGGTMAVGGGPATGGSGAEPGAGGTGGSAGGTSGAAGTGGRPPDHCVLPADSGPCEAAIDRWYFDARTGICRPFIYGGCEGNLNNFETLEQCSAECAGAGTTDPTACDQPTDCVVVPMNCCGGSGMPTLHEVTAINSAAYQEFTMPCQLVDCASTLGPIPPEIGATCSAGHCLAFDIREMPLTECTDANQCMLRAGLSCCGGCGLELDDWVALRSDADISELVCGDGPIACDPCVAEPSPIMSAQCVAGRCDVALALPTPAPDL